MELSSHPSVTTVFRLQTQGGEHEYLPRPSKSSLTALSDGRKRYETTCPTSGQRGEGVIGGGSNPSPPEEAAKRRWD